MRVAY